MSEQKNKARWYGPKQLQIMVYTAIVMLISASVVGGNNNTVFPAIAELRGWDVSILNVVSGFAAMLAGIGVLFFSRLTKKIGPKVMISVTLLISAALLLVFGRTQSIIVFLAVILVLGFLSAGYDKCGSMVWTANWWPTKKGIVLGFTTMGIVAMNVVYVPLMPKLFSAVGIPMGMTVIAIILAVVAIIGLALKNTPEEAGEYPDGDPAHATELGQAMAKEMKEYKSPFTFAKLAKDRNTWLISIGGMLAYMACMSFIASTIPTLLAYGYEYTFASAVFAVGGIFAFIGSFLFGLIDTKIGTKKAYVPYFICIIIAFILCLFMAKSAMAVWAASIILFCAQGAGCNLLPSYVATKYGRWDYAAAYQIMGTIFALGGGLGIMMTGFFHNPTTMYIFDIVILVIGFIMMLCSNDKFVGKAN